MSVAEKNIIPFRAMSETDLDEVLKLEADGHAIPWTRGIFQDCLRVGYYCPVFESDGVYLVYAIMSAAAGEAHILNVCVNKTHRKQGLGRRAISHLLDVAKQNKINTVFLEVRPSNEIAINLYDSIGFIEVGQRKDYYPKPGGKREDALLMAMELNFEL